MASGLAQVLESAVAAHRAGELDQAKSLYLRILAVEAHADALHLLGLIFYQKGEAAAGADLIERALTLAPSTPPFLENLAVAAWAAGRRRRALTVARRGLAIEPSESLLGIAGQALVAEGDYDGALSVFSVLAARGSSAASLDVAFCLRRLGRRREAEDLYRDLAVRDQDPRPLAALAEMAAEMARHGEAIPLWRKALARAPADPTLLYGLGDSLSGVGRHDRSIVTFERALLPIDGGDDALTAAVLMGLAGARQRSASASPVGPMRRALALVPGDAASWRNASEVIRADDTIGVALAFSVRALAIDRSDPGAHGNRGLALSGLGKPHAARSAFRRAAVLAPSDPRHLANLAGELQQLGDFTSMRVTLQRALALAPGFTPAEHTLAIAYMLAGEPTLAWRHYEKRFSPPAVLEARPFPQRWWEGGRTAGKLLIWGEQGMGDEVRFASLLPDVVALGHDVVLEADPRLVPIFARSFPSIEVIARRSPPDARLLAPDIDAQIAMGSLARFFRPTLASFTKACSYLTPDPERRIRSERWISSLGPGLKVGIAWRSKHRDIRSSRMHTTLDAWKPVLATPGVSFVNLQYGDSEAELRMAEAMAGIEIHHMPDLDLLDDLEGVLALSAGLDLIVSTCTSAYMLGAAAGVTTWLLKPRMYYLDLGQAGAPWFPETRGFLREPGESWERPMRAAAAMLREYAAERPVRGV